MCVELNIIKIRHVNVRSRVLEEIFREAIGSDFFMFFYHLDAACSFMFTERSTLYVSSISKLLPNVLLSDAPKNLLESR